MTETQTAEQAIRIKVDALLLHANNHGCITHGADCDEARATVWSALTQTITDALALAAAEGGLEELITLYEQTTVIQRFPQRIEKRVDEIKAEVERLRGELFNGA